eukprot:902204-Heterocapsa_arctica.AAC.1
MQSGVMKKISAASLDCPWNTPAPAGKATLWRYDLPVPIWVDLRAPVDVDGPRHGSAYLRPGEIFA